MNKLNEMRALNLNVVLDNKVVCRECGQMLAHIMPDCEEGVLHLICKCGNSGYIDWGRKPDDENIYEAVDMEGRNLNCPVCHKCLISVGENVSGISFKIGCGCGHYFDRLYERKRKIY